MSQQQKPVLSIVIVSYNVKDLLLECLHSIRNSVSIPHEVLVIDNASADGTCAAVKEMFPEVILTESKANLGFSAGNNVGLKQAKGEYILMLNPDAAFIDNSFPEALAYLQKAGTKNLLLGPRILNPDKSFQSSAWKFPNVAQHFLESIFLNRFLDIISYPEAASTKEAMPVDFVSGAAILLSKQTLNEIGQLDEDLFWMDDTDLGYRNLEKGGENIYFPGWKIIHHIGQSSAKNLSLVISNQIISKLKFYKKYKRYFSFFFSFFIFLLHVILRLVSLLPFAPFHKRTFAKWKAYATTFGKLWKYLFMGKISVT